MDVEILVGLPEDLKANVYKNARVTFKEVLFSSVQMPENERILGVPGSIWFKFWRLERDVVEDKVRRAIPEGALCYSLYILEWESCINLAAMEASFEWAEP